MISITNAISKTIFNIIVYGYFKYFSADLTYHSICSNFTQYFS